MAEESSDNSVGDAQEPFSNFQFPISDARSEQPQTSDSLEPPSSSPDRTQLSDDSQEPIQLIPTLSVVDATDYSHAINPLYNSPRSTSTSQSIITPDHARLGEDSHRSLEDSASPILDFPHHLQLYDNSVCHAPKLSIISVDLKLPDNVYASNDSHQLFEPTSTFFIVDSASQSQLESRTSSHFPQSVPSSSGIIASEDTLVGDNSYPLLKVPFVQKPRTTAKSLQHSGTISTVPGIENYDRTQSGDNSHQAQEPFATIPVIDGTEQASFGDDLLYPPELIPSSLDVVALDPMQFNGDSDQFSHLPSFSVDSIEHSQSGNIPLPCPPAPVPSPYDIDFPNKIRVHSEVPGPVQFISTLPVPDTAAPSQLADVGFHEARVLAHDWTSALHHQSTESPQTNMCFHVPDAILSSRGFDTPDNNELVNGHLDQEYEFTTNPASDTGERAASNENPLARSAQLFSSSPGINSLEKKESSDDHMQPSPEDLMDLSGVCTVGDTQLDHESFDQPVLHMPTPVAPNVTHPQFIDNSSDEFQELTPPSPIHDSGSQSESSEEEPEISPLEYARANGLSRNYLQKPYHVSNLNVFADYQNGLTDDSHLPQFELSATVNTDERLTITKEAALLIASASKEEASDWVDDAILRMINNKYKIPRLELPLLRTDHETDCKKFAQREGFEMKLSDVKLPLEMVDQENNGGLGFSPGLWNKGAEVLEDLKKERLEVSKDTLVHLQAMLKNDWTEEDEGKVWASTRTYQKKKPLEPVTPPLSPMYFPVQPYEPSMSDPAFDLPILSDPESLTKQDLETIEKKIFDEDVPTPIKNARDGYDSSPTTLVGSDTIKLADIYSPVASLDRAPVSPDVNTKRVKREDLKVEEPLTPPRPTELPKSVHFSNTILEWPALSGSPIADPFESSYFEEAFGDAHKEATRMSEQETLIAADTTARVDVQKMDFTMPNPPWEMKQSDRNGESILGMQKAMIKGYIGQGFPKWPGIGKIKVRYNPFPHNLAQLALGEDFVLDDSTWQAILNDPKDDEVIDTSTLTWKPSGLKILRDEDDDDDDEEIELGQFVKGVPQDISFLAKKRKMELEEYSRDVDLVMQNTSADSTAEQSPRKKTPNPLDFMSAVRKSQLGTPGIGSLLMGGAFSVGNSVENFLEIRGTKKPKLGDSSHFAKVSTLAKIKPNAQPEFLMQLPVRSSPAPQANTPLPAPPSKIPTTPVNAIVASPFLKHRSLIKHIEALFPRIVLVERDFAAHDTTGWMLGSVTRSPIASPLASEADIIISPLVGVIITTLQKIKQKPLPGQKTKPAIRERLEKVSPRYERLIVLVTEKREDEGVRDLDESDCNAFSEFVGFALCLDTSISIQFVGGGEATLAKWIVNATVQHRSDEELLADETHWELFLRRAGLNAFAAQYIIGALKPPDSIDLSSPSKAAMFGLTAFVEMDREQRIARFGPVCGNRLMARVSAVVDANWS